MGSLTDLCEQPILEVTTTDDTMDAVCSPDDCSLRDAVLMSNACPGMQTIHVPVGDYVLTRPGTGEDEGRLGDLDITASVIIQGVRGDRDYPTVGDSTWTRINGGCLDQVFHIQSAATEVDISGVFLNGCTGPLDTVDPSGLEVPVQGGVVLNLGGLILRDSVIGNGNTGSSSGTSGTGGGGLFNRGTAALSSVDVQNNHTRGFGGGIHNVGQLSLQKTNVFMNYPHSAASATARLDPARACSITRAR